MTGKVRQRCSDIGDLFTRAAIINDVFQDHFQNIVHGLNARRRETGANTKSEEEERRGDLMMVRDLERWCLRRVNPPVAVEAEDGQ
jgi:hypothetical protein